MLVRSPLNPSEESGRATAFSPLDYAFYSVRSALTGSTPMARRAGNKHADSATKAMMAMATEYVTGSLALIP